MACNSNRKISAKAKFVFLALVLVALLSLPAFAADTDISSAQTGVVYVEMMGKKTPVALSGTTDVDNVIRRMGITLGEHDSVEPSLKTRVSGGETIKITLREYATKTVQGEIEHETIYYYSAEAPAGKKTVVVKGENGHGIRTLKLLKEDGKVVEETVVSEDFAKKPITQEIAIGFRSEPVSPLDFEWEFDQNGEPIGAEAVQRGQRATAYTATGNLTATGVVAQVGYVAVDPAEIPYGSKLFIQASDGEGSFIYGYAIAADTGGAMWADQAQVDLYMNTRQDCLRYGAGIVDIFILETPKQA